MAVEIERKFLVTGEYKHLATSYTHIAQGYLAKSNGCTVRVRLRDERGYLTIKGPSRDGGLSRYEFETEIPSSDARYMLTLCHDGVVEKYRYLVPSGEHTIEVDEFLGHNAGLIIAEVELSCETESISLPPFIGTEVTGDIQYYNAYLSAHPYDTWPHTEP
ncbi:MAG: CYTH domain-containing protein [Bacteroidales bacterium]|nr:CYTH domain-containing protein [Bacteroidales bacterium]